MMATKCSGKETVERIEIASNTRTKVTTRAVPLAIKSSFTNKPNNVLGTPVVHKKTHVDTIQ